MDALKTQVPMPIEPPNGMYPARVDSAGRMKLPVGFQEYFASLPEKKLFVTSLNRRTGQVYPIAAWRANKKFFSEYREDPKKLQRIIFNANALGADSEMDGQGRILLPPEMRRKLEIENQPVFVFFHNERMEIYSQPVYEEMEKQAESSSGDDVTALEHAGMK
jgi:MraZ protein